MSDSMGKPGVLSLIDLGDKEVDALVVYLSRTIGTDSYYFLRRLLKDEFLMFIDVFSGSSFRIPQRSRILQLIDNLRIYFYIENRKEMSPEDFKNAAKIFGRKEKYLRSVHQKVKRVLLTEGDEVFNE